MTSPQEAKELEAALEHLWGGGLDFGSSKDFAKLDPEESDRVYIRYQSRLMDNAWEAVNH